MSMVSRLHYDDDLVRESSEKEEEFMREFEECPGPLASLAMFI